MEPQKLVKNQRGQIVVEYVLMLAIVVTVTTFFAKRLIGSEENSEGTVIAAWVTVTKTIANDLPEVAD